MVKVSQFANIIVNLADRIIASATNNSLKTTYYQNKVIIITGASSGIGETAAIKFSKLGAKIVLAARNADKLIEIQNRILSDEQEAFSVKTDVSSKHDVENLINKTIEKWGRIDIYISNAGQYIQGQINEIDSRDFQNSFDVNFYGSLYAVKKLIPIMSSQKSGHIVFINSLDAKKPIVGDGAYVAAKCALDGFGEVLRQEVKKKGIKVLTVYPGRVDTPMVENIKVPKISEKISPDQVVKAMIKGIQKNKVIVVVPRILFPLGAFNNLFPKLMDWLYFKFKLEGEKRK